MMKRFFILCVVILLTLGPMAQADTMVKLSDVSLEYGNYSSESNTYEFYGLEITIAIEQEEDFTGIRVEATDYDELLAGFTMNILDDCLLFAFDNSQPWAMQYGFAKTNTIRVGWAGERDSMASTLVLANIDIEAIVQILLDSVVIREEDGYETMVIPYYALNQALAMAAITVPEEYISKDDLADLWESRDGLNLMYSYDISSLSTCVSLGGCRVVDGQERDEYLFSMYYTYYGMPDFSVTVNDVGYVSVSSYDNEFYLSWSEDYDYGTYGYITASIDISEKACEVPRLSATVATDLFDAIHFLGTDRYWEEVGSKLIEYIGYYVL